MEGDYVTNSLLGNMSYLNYTESPKQDDPRILAASYMMYKIGEFALSFVV